MFINEYTYYVMSKMSFYYFAPNSSKNIFITLHDIIE